MWHVTHDMLHMTHDMWHITHRGWWILCPNSRSKALTFWEQWCFEDFEEKDHWLNKWITKECVLCISGTKNYRFELYICAKLFYFAPGHAVSASWRLSGGCWRRAPCSLSWRSFSRGRQSGSLEDRIQMRSRGVVCSLPLVPFMNSSSRWRMWRSGLLLRGGEEGEEGRWASRK